MTENKMLTASCENLEPSTITHAEHESKGNAHDAKLMEGESSLDVLNFFHQSCYDRANFSGAFA